MVAITVPAPVMPLTATSKVVRRGPVTVAVVAPAVPVRVTSPVSKPVTVSLNTAVKWIGLVAVGSVCPLAWLMVTVGPAGAALKVAMAAFHHGAFT